MSSTLRRAMLGAADALEGARERLCALDAQTGDGDHGLTMAIGARGVRRQLAAVDSDDPMALLRAAAVGMGSAGGAIGPIYARGLLAAATALQDAGGREPSAAVADPVGMLHRAAEAAATAVATLGHAAPGDKTVLDALGPVVDALAAAERDGRPVAAALDAARTAARTGAEATSAMEARIGRSSRFGERSIGTADPGATSFAIVVDAVVSIALGEVGGLGDAGAS